ncbi:hypothetical protein FPV67DRAFT_1700596 [Lyophyllum atratum]|nr:hypothetical protein FPV67DRAFT_1700596 [Lyophyllum atratum]
MTERYIDVNAFYEFRGFLAPTTTSPLMQNPQNDIKDVLERICTAPSPDKQKKTIDKYFAEDVEMRSPFFHIPSAPLSREDVLGVYQWYRIISPDNQVKVTNLAFDQRNNTMFVEISQLSSIRYSPFRPAPSRLRKEGKLFIITSQEDFYHPDDLSNLILPPFTPLVRLMLSATGYASAIAAKAAQVFGYWRVRSGQGAQGNQANGEDSQDSEDSSKSSTGDVIWSKVGLGGKGASKGE